MSPLRLLRGLAFVISGIRGGFDRHWTDPRDGTLWTLWLETAGNRPVLCFGSKGEVHKVVVGFDDGLEDLSNDDLQAWLDRGQGSS